jgi:hypothetical protein
MLSSAATAALRDIAHHIGLAAQFTAGLDYETLVADTRTVHALTRCLEIISEALRRLPDDSKARHPAIAWKDTAGAISIVTTMRTLPRSMCGTPCRWTYPAVARRNRARAGGLRTPA